MRKIVFDKDNLCIKKQYKKNSAYIIAKGIDISKVGNFIKSIFTDTICYNGFPLNKMYEVTTTNAMATNLILLESFKSL